MNEWQGKGWRVIHGRWQDSPPEQVDHVISDPPYDERTHEGAAYDSGKRIGGMSFAPLVIADVVPELIKRSRRWVICFCTLEDMGTYRTAAWPLAAWVRSGFWHKPGYTPQFSGDRPAQGGEAVAIMHRKGRKKWNGGGSSAFWSVSRPPNSDRFHETQKPLELMRRLVELFTDPGDLVWDPYGGSMTTGVACLALGRRFLGHEMQEHYARQGAERLAAAEQGLTLTAARAGQIPLFQGGAK